MAYRLAPYKPRNTWMIYPIVGTRDQKYIIEFYTEADARSSLKMLEARLLKTPVENASIYESPEPHYDGVTMIYRLRPTG